MKKSLWLAMVLLFGYEGANAQLIYAKEKIRSEYTIQNEKAAARKQRILAQAASLNTLPFPGTEDDMADLDAALWVTSQYMINTPESKAGITRLMKLYDQLPSGTQRSLLEIVYGLYPEEFQYHMKSILSNAANIRIASIAAAYLFRLQPDESAGNMLQQKIRQYPDSKAGMYADAFKAYVNSRLSTTPPPSLDSLLAWQAKHGFKVVYSFQRRNRNYAGLAIVQDSDGKLMRDSSGQLLHFTQLARSASNLPFFITNGSTPQGLYAITGTAISRNVFIGPTPNLQTVMMGEVNPPVFTHYFPIVFNAPPSTIYKSYFPENWQNWNGLDEAYMAGQIGRGDIIAHGTTIDPSWFEGHPFYPISPTLGCLCGREQWDPKTGTITKSDQLDMVNAFISTPGTKGYLVVIDLDDQQKPVSVDELKKIFNAGW